MRLCILCPTTHHTTCLISFLSIFGSKINFWALMGQNGATHFDNIGLESALEKNRSQLRPILMQICQFSL